jgi:rhamnulokinase
MGDSTTHAGQQEIPALDKHAWIAVDLGAESCRVSLLRWQENRPAIELVHRFPNHAMERADGLRWNLEQIRSGVEEGIRKASKLVAQDEETVRSIAVDGWAVDYVRLDGKGEPLADPYCYRDMRTIEAERALHEVIPPRRLHEITGVQLQRINTLYQQYADLLGGEEPAALWLNLPEYLLYCWGGRAVAERTNATHTGMIDLRTEEWSAEIVEAAQLEAKAMPELVAPGTDLGELRGALAELPALKGTRLIAPCCHDTASAIAGIAADGKDWAYISSGTWSLVGTLLDRPCNSEESGAAGFTNLAAAGGRICFHKNVNGMWLLRQSIETWAVEGQSWQISELIAAARQVPSFAANELIEVDDPELLLPGRMPQRINEQRARHGLAAMSTAPGHAPQLARLIFESLAARYAQVLGKIAALSGKPLRRIYIVGGGSQNELLNELTARATGMEVHRGSVESSTIGNFVVQWATLDGDVSPERIAQAARSLRVPG